MNVRIKTRRTDVPRPRPRPRLGTFRAGMLAALAPLIMAACAGPIPRPPGDVGPELGPTSADALSGLGRSLQQTLSWGHLIQLALWLGLIYAVTFAAERAVRILAPRVRAGEDLIRWMPTVRLLAAGVAAILALAAFMPDAPAARALIATGVAATALWASRDVLRNAMAGVIVIARRAVQVGDYIRLGEHEGAVKAVTLRGIELRTPTGTRTVVPNIGLNTQAITYVTGHGRAVPVIVEVALPIVDTPPSLEVARRTALRMGRLSPRRAPGTPVLVDADLDKRRIWVTVTPFCDDASVGLRVELAERLRAALVHGTDGA